MKKLALIIPFCFLISCNSDRLAEPKDSIKANNSQVYKKVESTFCKTTESLNEIEMLSTEKVYYGFTDYNAYGFLKGNGTCVHTEMYKKDGEVKDRFTMELRTKCVKNGSIWKLQSFSVQDNVTTIKLIELETSPANEIRIQAGYEVKLKDLQDELGLKFLKCEDSKPLK